MSASSSRGRPAAQGSLPGSSEKTPPPATKPKSLISYLFPGLFGAFLGLSMLKFGSPPITENYVSAPTNGYEFLFGSPWPIHWAFGRLTIITFVGLFAAKPPGRVPRSLLLLLFLPLFWFGW